MKMNGVFTVSLLVSSLILTACSKGTDQSHTTTQEAAKKTTLNLGSDMTFPPYEYLEDGKPKGVDVEIMAKMAELDGSYEPNWMDTRWANLIPGLKSKKFDVLFSSMYITKERLQQIDMIPYYKTDIALLVRSDSTLNPKGPNDLCGKVVGTMKGTTFAIQVQEISEKRCEAEGKPAIKVREFETSPQTTQALLAHAVDIQYDDVAVMNNAVKNLGSKVKITSTESFYPILGGIGIRKGDTETYKKIEDGLNKIKASGDYQKILAAHGLQEPTADDIAKLMK
ncbi:polar amino acid transport system substrate-binding protein [Acinetobacter baylyi]|uniref:Polar amino acid transport system substrate-binding protein n=1 Tax=Acinetobacter baylyi TaxID=202950 RepID=A0ABU0UWT8_ACIBI|nr:ABC transporter substrate-binding protein [Acinetobacter baylyi]MDQ1209022.1 polar amino acid transport system substrate-binding protein [Acinetobacter baylyi]MDR6107381.1 polar amino acid transport system substrate-binding protein [Acinetobacter baylyi]MDR6185895.1 polar amino acid transport system substrate-binding protein [Acinetobacter baylyi]